MPKSGRVMRTDICIKPPLGSFIKITGRSGSALKNIHVSESEFDSNYSEPIKVLLFNHGNEPFLVLEKTRIAKIIVSRILLPPISVGRNIEALDFPALGN